MAMSLREFITAREHEIKAQIRALTNELRELSAAKSAISGDDSVTGRGSGQQRLTHSDMIISVLDDHVEGGTVDNVVAWVKAKFDVEIPRNSMSSQLSRAKGDGFLTLDHANKIWRSSKHTAKENEPPKGGSEGGEVTASPDVVG
jgi:hypothetical protein